MADAENESAITREEPPYKRRSPLWRHSKEIRKLMEAGYSYRQILERLALKVSITRLATFARDKLGITSRLLSEQSNAKAGQDPARRAGQGAGGGPKNEGAAQAVPTPEDIDSMQF